MALEQKLSLKLAQKLVMTPSLQQAIKLLQMTRMELEGVLTQELVENPVLEENSEVVEAPGEEGNAEKEEADTKEEEDPFDEIDLEAYFRDYQDGPATPSVREQREGAPIENTLAREPDLYDNLLWQLHMLEVPEIHRRIAEMIIGNLEPDGFLVASVRELCELAADELGLDLDEDGAETASASNGRPDGGGEAVASGAEVSADVLGSAVADEAAGNGRGDADGGPKSVWATEEDEAGPRIAGDDARPTGVPAWDEESLRAAGLPGFDAEASAARASVDGAEEASPAASGVAPAQQESRGEDEGAETASPADKADDADEAVDEDAEDHPLHSLVLDSLALVRSLEPPGVAQRDLRSSLLAQLTARGVGHDELSWRMIDECWDRFMKRQYPAIAKEFGVDLHDLEPAVELIKTLDTRPGRRFSTERTHYIEPDVVVQKISGDYVIQLNDDGLPKLRISRAYRRMLQEMRRDGRQAEARQFIKEKMRSAVWLIKSLDQRQRTIYKVANSIVQQQREFLDHGIDKLRPMVLRDVSEDIGMHESTVSRVVSNKYIHTPRGLFPMKFFFHSGIDREYGENISSLTVKRKLKRMIENEDSKRPLSDSELMRILNREGIQIARRTVAKYRDELNIPSSTDRKQIF